MGGTQKSFRFWVSYWDVAQELSPKQQGEFYLAIIEYMFTDNDPEDNLKGSTRLAFKAIKANLKTSKSRSEVGSKAIAKRWDGMTECDTKPIPNEYQIKSKTKSKSKTQIQSDEPDHPTSMPEHCKAELLKLREVR